MRGLWSTIAAILVLAGLGAYIYFKLWDAPEDLGPKGEKIFAGIQADKIDELKIKSESGDITTLKKDDGWKLVDPVQAKASESDAAGIPAALTTIEITRVIEEKAGDLKQYGLDPPRIEVNYNSADGKTSGRLAFGQKTSTGSSVYAARNGDPRVFTVASFQENAFNKSTFDLRDKVVMSLQRDKIDGLEVVSGGKPIKLTKESTSGEWKITEPIMERADAAGLDALIGRIDSVVMRSVATENATPADLKKYGLDKPSETATLSMGSARATLEIGGAADEMSVYARDASRNLVAAVDKGIVDELKKGVDDFRRKDLFDFRPFNVTRVEFVRNGQTIAFERVKGTDGKLDTWKRVSPNPADVDTTKTETMLGAFADLRVSSFEAPPAKTGTDMPVLVVNAAFEGGKQEKATFGQVGSDSFVVRTGDAKPLKTDSDPLNGVIKQLDDLTK